ncbi:uncharacterized protein AMSG_01295 [Thecamonas trahens ATCC 50062]|uniref:Polyketide synthase n=1 Tax=Thecamonas trahens ATCC 50062 TaxID=461836 RepID=A0A0L0DMV7_THETB|nr:hypothetical protein AMSG_01295 [Thecamonas trahens ATCC 50062]KNC53585.1 hypothetical protein AMSG_01295 [Thecamonas trahens ATCC 50062]|eukprot:XP_013761902.1 hypothetical protein AMSG_01295 [Thecamonas trahens ATCC 50062]
MPRLAVVGAACNYPGSQSLKELWENVLASRRQFRDVPDERLPLGDYGAPEGGNGEGEFNEYDPDWKDKTTAKYAAVLDGVSVNAREWRANKAKVASTDVVHWLALQVAASALDSVDLPAKLNEGFGVIVGNTLTGETSRASLMRLRWPFVERELRETAAGQGLAPEAIDALVSGLKTRYKAAFAETTEDTLAGALSNTIAGHVSKHYGLQGCAYTVDGACASSALAVAVAADQLAAGNLDVALVGGVDISLDPLELVGFSRAGALSSTDMNVYGAAADGFFPGEGCGFVVIMRADDATDLGLPILSFLDGWGISADGYEGIMRPFLDGQALAISRAYARASFDPRDTHFVEGHGTGTPTGDPIELGAIHKVLAAATADAGEPAVEPACIGVTSIKSIIGHTKAASGIAAFLKAVLGVNQRVIPPMAGIQLDSVAPALAKLPGVYPVIHGRALALDTDMHAASSSMGFGGINVHLIVSSTAASPPLQLLGGPDHLARERYLASAQDAELLVFNAPSLTGLLAELTEAADILSRASWAEVADYAAHLAAAAAASDADLCAATVAAVVTSLAHAQSLVADAIAAASDALALAPVVLPESLYASFAPSWKAADPELVWVCAGQGTQRAGMALQLCRRFSATHRAELLGIDPNSELAAEVEAVVTAALDVHLPVLAAPHPQLLATLKDDAQRVLAVTEALWIGLLRRCGVPCGAVAGHSLGDVIALYAAGVFDFATLWQVVDARARAFASAPSGGMAVMRGSADAAAALLASVPTGNQLVVANINAPDRIVLAGPPDAIATAVAAGADAGLPGAVLASVSAPFHTPSMADVAASFEAALLAILEETTLAKPSVPVYSSCRGGELELSAMASPAALATYLAQCVASPVDYVGVVAAATAAGHKLGIEIGSYTHDMTRMTRRCGDALKLLPVEARPGCFGAFLDLVARSVAAAPATLALHPLFDHRFVREWVDPRSRTFIVNPCESPIYGPPLQDATKLRSRVATVSASIRDRGASAANDRGSDVRAAARRAAARRKDHKAARSKTNSGKPRSKAAVAFETAVVPSLATAGDAATNEALAKYLAVRGKYLASLIEADMRKGGVQAAIEAADAAAEAKRQQRIRAMSVAATAAVLTAEPSMTAALVLEVVVDLASEAASFAAAPTTQLLELYLDSIKSVRFITDIAVALGLDASLVNPTSPDWQKPMTLASLAKRMHILCESSGGAGQRAGPASGGLASGASQSVWSWLGIFDEMPLPLFPNPDPIASIESATLVVHVGDDSAAAAHNVASGLGLAEPTIVIDLAADAAAAAAAAAAASYLIVVAPQIPDPATSAGAAVTATATVMATLGRLVRAVGDVWRMEDRCGGRINDGGIIYVLHGDGPVPLRGFAASALLEAGSYVPAAVVTCEPSLSPADAGRFTAALLTRCPLEPKFVIATTSGPAPADGKSWIAFRHPRPYSFDSSPLLLDAPALASSAVAVAPVSEAAAVVSWCDALARGGDAPRSTLGAVVVSGGGKGITAECIFRAAAYLSLTRLVLVGTSPASHPQVTATLERMARVPGLQARYYVADVTDRPSVDAMLEALSADEPSWEVVGLVHGAATNKPAATDELGSGDAAARDMQVKVCGAAVLLDALHTSPRARGEPGLEFIVGLSSIIAATGMFSAGVYGSANLLMERVFGSVASSVPVVLIRYGVWEEVGMGARMGSVEFMEASGMTPLSVEAGSRAFVELLAEALVADNLAAPIVAVVASRLGGLATWCNGWNCSHPRVRNAAGASILSNAPAFDSVAALEPNLELTLVRKMSIQNARYLADHSIGGSVVVPAAVELALCVQAAAGLHAPLHPPASTKPSWKDVSAGSIVCRDFAFPLALDVHRRRGAVVAVTAANWTAAPRLDGQAHPWSVVWVQNEFGKLTATGCVGIVTTDTLADGAFARCAAPLKLLADARSSSPTYIDVKADIYEPGLLFHTSVFRRISAIRALMWDEAAGRGHVIARVSRTPGGVDDVMATRESLGGLGDPLFRDGVIQCALAIIPQEVSLPSSLSALYVHQAASFALADADVLDVVLTLTREYNGVYAANVVVHGIHSVSGASMVAEEWYGLRYKVVRHDPTRPAAADLLAPSARDNTVLNKTMSEAAFAFGIELPKLAVCAAELPFQAVGRPAGVQAMIKTARRKAQAEMVTDLVGSHAKLGHSPTGAPHLVLRSPGSSKAETGLSFSYTERVLAAACDDGSAGFGSAVGIDVVALRDDASRVTAAMLPHKSHRKVVVWLTSGGYGKVSVDSAHVARARIWAALEAAFKARGPLADASRGWSDASVGVLRRRGDAVLLWVEGPNGAGREGKHLVLTLPLQLTRSGKIMTAVTAREAGLDTLGLVVPGPQLGWNLGIALSPEPSNSSDIAFTIRHRMAVSFHDTGSASATFLFARLYDVIGRTRELSMRYSPEALSEATRFSEGEVASVSDWVHVVRVREIEVKDVLQVEFRAVSVTEASAVFSIRMLAGRSGTEFVPVAYATLGISAVRVEGREAARTPWTAAFMRFLCAMAPRVSYAEASQAVFRSVLDGSVLASPSWHGGVACQADWGVDDAEWAEARAAPATDLGGQIWASSERGGAVVHVWQHTTDRMASNFVGNVYFAEYGAWMGAAWESLIHDVDAAAEAAGSLRVHESNIVYEVESFPFDSLSCEVGIAAVHDTGVVVDFVFRRPGVVLARGRQVYCGEMGPGLHNVLDRVMASV